MSSLRLPYPDKIARDSPHEFNFNVLRVNFKDTLENIKPLLINDTYKTFQVTWLDLSKAEKNSLKASLKLGGSWQRYRYNPCNEDVTYIIRVEKDSVSINIIGNNLFAVSAKLKQVF